MWQSHCISPVGSSASTLNEVGHQNMDRHKPLVSWLQPSITLSFWQEDYFDGLPSLSNEVASIVHASKTIVHHSTGFK